MKIDCAYDELVAIEKLVPHPRNNNRHSIEQIDAIAKLINAHGFRNAIVVSKRSGFIVAGHGRLEALKKLKVEQVPVDYQDFASEAEEYQCLTADNEIARWAELDYQEIKLATLEIPELKIELLGLQSLEGLTKEFLDEGTLEDQGLLDEKQMTSCPNCGEIFDHAKNKA